MIVAAGFGGAVLLKTREDAAAAAREAAGYTPPPFGTQVASASVGPPSAAPRVTVAILGDESVDQAGGEVPSRDRWPQLLPRDVGVTTLVSSGVGYAGSDTSGGTIGDRVRRIPLGTDIVVFTGGVHDTTVAPLSVARSATATFAAARERVPRAKLVVVGPLISGGASSQDLVLVRNALRASAALARATWVDPVAAGWIPEGRVARAADLTAADERGIAKRIGSIVNDSAAK